MHLLIFNLGVNKNDPPLAFTIDWITEFAKHCEQVTVLTMSQGAYTLPDNVRVYDIGHRPGRSKLVLLYNFYRHLFYILSRYRIDGCFSHMNQLFSALGGGILWLAGIRLVTWYAHRSITFSLKMAHFFSTYTVASLYNAYPYKKNKLRVIGQGIDTLLFRRNPAATANPSCQLLYTGRITECKYIDILVKAVEILHSAYTRKVSLAIVGDTYGPQDIKYKHELMNMVKAAQLEQYISFRPAVPRYELPALYANAQLYVNLTHTGSGDKVAWEAMACEVPTLVANSDFAETLGKYKDLLLFNVDDAADLAQKIDGLMSKSNEEVAIIGSYLRHQVIALHSLERLPEKVLGLFASA